MPPIKHVPTLFETCLKCYANHCMFFFMKLMLSDTFDKVRFSDVEACHHLDSLLKNAREYVLEYTIVHTRKDLLKILIKESLSLSSFFDILEVLKYILVIHGGEWIQDLDLRHERFCSPCGDIALPVLSQTVFHFPSWSESLVTLKLSHFRNLEIVKTVGCHCHNLQHLDIIFDDCRSPASLSFLRYLYGAVENVDGGCPKLKSITLPKCPSNPELIDHVVKMIQFMPDLHIIRNVDSRLVAIRYSSVSGRLCTLKLTEFEEWNLKCSRGGDYDTVNEALGTIFPNVRRYVSNVYHNRGLLEILTDFPHLQVVEVHKCTIDSVEDITSVRDTFPSVKMLRIFQGNESDDHIEIENIQPLSAVFPNLEKLILHCSGYFVDDFQGDTFLQKLNTLELHTLSEIDAEFLCIFLEKCPALTTLELFCAEPTYLLEAPAVTDEFLQILSSKMENLERLIIEEDLTVERLFILDDVRIELTYSSVQCILSSCPNLRFLGDLRSWNITETQIGDVIDYIQKNNWDLELVLSERND